MRLLVFFVDAVVRLAQDNRQLLTLDRWTGSMSTHLFTVQGVFDIGGCYLIPVPGVPITIAEIRAGLPIELRRPNGSTIATVIWCLVWNDPYDAERPIQIGLQGLTKEDIPVGTEIWLSESPVAE